MSEFRIFFRVRIFERVPLLRCCPINSPRCKSEFSLLTSPIQFIMARGNTSKVKKIRPQLTTCQKAARRAKFVALTDDVNGARTTYMDQVQVLAKKHGR